MRRPAKFRRRQYGDAVKLRAAEAYLAGEDKQQIVERFEITSLDTLEWIVRSLLMDAARHERSKAIARRFLGTDNRGATTPPRKNSARLGLTESASKLAIYQKRQGEEAIKY